MDEDAPEEGARPSRDPRSPGRAVSETAVDRGVEGPARGAPRGGTGRREGEGAGSGEEPRPQDDGTDAPQVDRARRGREYERAVRIECERAAEREPDEKPGRPPCVQQRKEPACGVGIGKDPAAQEDPERAACGPGQREREGGPVEGEGLAYRPPSRFEEKKRKISSPAWSR